MARPKVFISSTYFDLRQVRADISQFLNALGYETVRAEKGEIPYGSDEPPEDYCYREIDACDIFVLIVGGRRGSISASEERSIVEREAEAATRANKPVYIFIDRNVNTEYETWDLNREVADFKPKYVDSADVFIFIERLRGLPRGNPIFAFSDVDELQSILTEQLSGLVQRLLRDAANARAYRIIEDIQSTAKTLQELVPLLTQSVQGSKAEAYAIRQLHHPSYKRLQESLQTPYPTVFRTLDELKAFFTARSWKYMGEKFDPFADEEDGPEFHYWQLEPNKNAKIAHRIEVRSRLFSKDGKLDVDSDRNWRNEWIVRRDVKVKQAEEEYNPFGDE